MKFSDKETVGILDKLIKAKIIYFNSKGMYGINPEWIPDLVQEIHKRGDSQEGVVCQLLERCDGLFESEIHLMFNILDSLGLFHALKEGLNQNVI